MSPRPLARVALLAAFASVTPLFTAVSFQGIPIPSAPQQAFGENSERGNTRLFFWGGNRSGGQATIDYGRPVWKESYDQDVEKNLGTRWRLGQNFWTSLDTNMDLTFGEVEILAGHYFLGLEHKTDKSFVLHVFDPEEIRQLRLDAFQIDQTKESKEIPLDYKKADAKAERLEIRLTPDASVKNGATLSIRFGAHHLSAPLLSHPSK